MKDKEVYVTNLYALNEKYFLGCAVFGADAPIVLMDKDLNIISNFGNLKERPKNGVVPNPMLVILHPMATVLYTQ